jgi:hypothetical protein
MQTTRSLTRFSRTGNSIVGGWGGIVVGCACIVGSLALGGGAGNSTEVSGMLCNLCK